MIELIVTPNSREVLCEHIGIGNVRVRNSLKDETCEACAEITVYCATCDREWRVELWIG